MLIVGETGTGKELFAHLLHGAGPRAAKPMVSVNCAALTATLAESQLFGHEKGAFTGAEVRSLGVFRAADGGIVFLDEIGEMPLDLQPKLLRVLQQREVTPVGAAHTVAVNVQVIAATNRDLDVHVASGQFREDLFYRLNMVELRVPAFCAAGRHPRLHRILFREIRREVQSFAVAAQSRGAQAILRVPLARQHSPIVAGDRAKLRARRSAHPAPPRGSVGFEPRAAVHRLESPALRCRAPSSRHDCAVTRGARAIVGDTRQHADTNLDTNGSRWRATRAGRRLARRSFEPKVG